jgi:hypothetical protein
VTTDLRALHEQLKHDWCDSFSIEELPDGGLTVTTPFAFGDGDGYPVVVERREGRWRITDRGLAVSHLQFSELEFTGGRRQQIGRIAVAHGYSFVDDVLAFDLDDLPSVEDIADFLVLVAQVSGLPLQVPERESDQFRTRAREHVRRWLADPESAKPNWQPPRPKGDLFPADLMIPAPQRSVVAFFAGSNQKADRSMAFVGQYLRWGLEVKPLLAHNGTLSSDTIYRAQTTLDDDSAVVEVQERAAETGYLRLRRTLAGLGVLVR